MTDDYPMPNEAIKLIMDLHKSKRLTKEEIIILNRLLIDYLNLRAEVYYPELQK